MLGDIIFIHEDELSIKVCQAWQHTEDMDELVNITKFPAEALSREIARLKLLGMIQDGKKISEDADKYIKTYVASKINPMTTKGGSR